MQVANNKTELERKNHNMLLSLRGIKLSEVTRKQKCGAAEPEMTAQRGRFTDTPRGASLKADAQATGGAKAEPG